MSPAALQLLSTAFCPSFESAFWWVLKSHSFGRAPLLVLRFRSSLHFPSPEKLLILRQKEWKMRVHQQLLFVLDAALLVHVPMSQEELVCVLGAQKVSAVEYLVPECSWP